MVVEPTNEELRAFQAAWQKDVGETLSLETARTELCRLLTFLQIFWDAFYGPDRPLSTPNKECDTIGP